jgi:hypothetical protein
MIDFWLGIYQLKQIIVHKNKEMENDNILIPELFSPNSCDSPNRNIDDVDIYDIDVSLANVTNLRDAIIPASYSQLLSAVQLLHSLRAAVQANLMTSRVTGYVKKKTFFSLVNKSKGAAYLTTDTKLVPDVTSLEYRVCHCVLYMLQMEFEELLSDVTARVQLTMDHIKEALCSTLAELDPLVTREDIEESGLCEWSNPALLTDWSAYVTSLHQKKKEDEVNGALAAKDAAKRKSGVLKTIRKSVTGSLLSFPKNTPAENENVQTLLYTNILSLAPLHKVYLNVMEKLNMPSSPICLKNLSERVAMSTASRPRKESDLSDEGSAEPDKPKWYFGRFVGRKSPGERTERARTVSSAGSSASTDDHPIAHEGDKENVILEYAKIFGQVFILEDETAAVEIDHRMIHAVVNEAPLLPAAAAAGGVVDSAVGGLRKSLEAEENNTDVRLFSWYMFVIMHNSRCVVRKIASINYIYDILNTSKDKETDKHCLGEYSKAGKDLMDSAASTTQTIRR